jgi:hypothetical protein
LGVTNIQDRIEFEIREVVTLGTDNPNLRIHLMKRSA